MTVFALRVDDDIDLVLREAWTNGPVAELIARNLARLREWEPWAQGDPDPERQAAFALASLRGWVDGTDVPTVIRLRGRIVGTIGAVSTRYTESPSSAIGSTGTPRVTASSVARREP